MSHNYILFKTVVQDQSAQGKIYFFNMCVQCRVIGPIGVSGDPVQPQLAMTWESRFGRGNA